MRIVLGNGSLAQYQLGGGHWSWFLQYALGLKALGHDIEWLELLRRSGDRERDSALIRGFFARIAPYQLERDCTLLLIDDTNAPDLGRAETFGHTRAHLERTIRDSDLLWNLSCAIREPLLSRFRRRVLIDTDPGHLQVAALTVNLDIPGHDAFLTVGSGIGEPQCAIPTLGLQWKSFVPFVHLPMWETVPDPGIEAPFTSITQWTWEELHWGGRVLSASKRAAYLAYADLPRDARRPFELAVNIGTSDPGGDRERLRKGGWRLSDPHEIAATPETYRAFIRRSRAEILCPKPIYRELRTGWFSDRSVAYLASGRPVLAEETGFSARIPTGRGLVMFSNLDEAVAGVGAIDADYAHHSRTARELAEAYFDARRVLPAMLAASGT
jgi:hypothetical protein